MQSSAVSSRTAQVSWERIAHASDPTGEPVGY